MLWAEHSWRRILKCLAFADHAERRSVTGIIVIDPSPRIPSSHHPNPNTQCVQIIVSLCIDSFCWEEEPKLSSDSPKLRPTGMRGAAQSWLSREPAPRPHLLQTGLRCVISAISLGSCCPSLSTPCRPSGARTYFESLEVARPSLSVMASHGSCRGALRMSARLVTASAASTTVCQAGGLCGPSGYNLFS